MESCTEDLNQLVFLILYSHYFVYERAMCFLEKLHLEINIIVIINHEILHLANMTRFPISRLSHICTGSRESIQ